MSDEAHQILQDRFGLSQFRPGQLEVITRIIARQSTLAIFPTGGGKSLCYQLPALLLENLTIVVSPLLALIREQVETLNGKGISAVRIDSTLDANGYQETIAKLRSGEAKMLYIAPERFFNERFRESMRTVPIDLLAIDEAHCISQWGHNFRPDYLRLTDAVKQFNIPVVLALTATATKQVATDIRNGFGIAEENQIRTPFHRQNLELRFESIQPSRRAARLVEILKANPGSTIVYTTLQKTAEAVAAMLVEAGLRACSYHAGMDDTERKKVQDDFMSSDDMIVVATIAFGMGIDKSNIRTVIHYNISNGLENYAQEIGRAGRDGKSALCHTFVCASDRTVVENFAHGDTPSAESIDQFVSFIAGQSEEFFISHYSTAYEFDIRDLVVRTMLTYLELDGYLESIGPRYDAYQFKPIKTPAWILTKFEGERRKFVNDVLSMSVRKKIWTEINMPVAARRLNESRARIAAMLEYFAEHGWIELKPSGLMHGYRKLKPIDKPKIVARQIRVRLEALEKAAVERVEQLIELAASTECQALSLAKHFADKSQRRCKKCSACSKDPFDMSLATCDTSNLGSSVRSLLAPLQTKYPELFEDQRRVAKFLCGISTPHLIRKRLTRNEAFGCCQNIPFPLVLAQLESS